MKLTVQNNAQGKERSEKLSAKIMRTDYSLKRPSGRFQHCFSLTKATAR